MTNHSKASFKICKEIEGRYKVTCRLTRIHVEVCQRLKDSYTLIETFMTLFKVRSLLVYKLKPHKPYA